MWATRSPPRSSRTGRKPSRQPRRASAFLLSASGVRPMRTALGARAPASCAQPTLHGKYFSNFLKIAVDREDGYRHNSFCCFDVRRYLSWIEGLTTNQYVGGSNPSRRTILDRSEQNRSRLERFFFCQAKERNVLEGSKIETSQYVDFRLLASARSSEGTTAEHQPSPWAPLRLRSHRQRPAHAAPPRCTDAHRTEERTCSIFLK